MDILIEQPPQRGRGLFWDAVMVLLRAFTLLAGLAMIAMALLTCVDIVMRMAGCAFTGTYDIVRLLAVLAVAGALPVTTATKGHVAIEYFFNKLAPRARFVVDSLMRVLMIVALGFATWGLLLLGEQKRLTNEVSTTLPIPIFWTFWVCAVSCALTALVVLFHLVKPGKEMVKP